MAENKPQRLYFETYLQLIRRSVGTEMFRNFYVEDPEKGRIDALDDGENSCAFYVSGVLTMFAKLQGVHGTVDSTLKDLENSGWQKVEDIQAGDVILWEAREFPDGVTSRHIGFARNGKRAMSTSWTEKKVIEHDIRFDGKRAIEQIYRCPSWN